MSGSYVSRLATITAAFIADKLLIAPLPSRFALIILEELDREADSLERKWRGLDPKGAPMADFLYRAVTEYLAQRSHPEGPKPELSPLKSCMRTQLQSFRSREGHVPPSNTLPLIEDVLHDCLSLYRKDGSEAIWHTDRQALAKLIYACVKDDPGMQADLSHSTTFYPGKWLLEQELSRRRPTSADFHDISAQLPHGTPASWTETDDRANPCNGNDVFIAAAQQRLTGLCFSGGGIRSATFNLGVLQTLAEFKLLRHFDYLSTVSGGGYIHQWLASWIYRAKGGIDEVEKKLVAQPQPGCRAEAPHEIFWLRRFSSYLTPQRGLFSADTWTLISIWFRNTSLNQIVLFSFLGFALLTGRVLTHSFVCPSRFQAFLKGDHHWNYVVDVFAFGSLFLCYMLSNALFSVAEPVAGRAQGLPSGSLSFKWVFFSLVLPSFLLSLLLAATLADWPAVYCTFWAISVFAVLAAIITGGNLYANFLEVKFGKKCPSKATIWQRSRARGAQFGFWLTAALIAAGAGFSAYWLVKGFLLADSQTVLTLNHLLTCRSVSHAAKTAGGICKPISPEWLLVPGTMLGIFAPPALSVLLFFASHLQIGIIGRFLDESRREWLARFRGATAIISLTWIIFAAIGRIGPIFLHWLFLDGASSWTGFTAVVTFVTVHGATLYAGSSSKTSGRPSPKSFFGYTPLDLVGIIGAPIAILLLLLLVSGLLGFVVPDYPFRTAGILAAVLIFFGWRVDVNEFSMHAFYRNRLARCYLGATNLERVPDPFTGFDDHETTTASGSPSSIAVADLVPSNFKPERWRWSGTAAPRKPSYTGPYPIFSCTLNLTSGKELAFQERKGASFFFSPICSGYHVGWTTAEKQSGGKSSWNGFAKTRDYAYRERGIQLPNAAAISGAALSPNQGFNSQPALAFLMTLFNVRLAWWIANPRRPRFANKYFNKPTPGFGLLSLLSELFGVSGDQSDYVCLCDGGFFENMGLYELIRRRCRYIVLCDAEEDAEMTFSGIGNAIRKCRSDFGVEIELDLRPLQLKGDTGFTTSHFQRGKITYPPPPGFPPPQYRPPPGCKRQGEEFEGVIIYIKSSMIGDEPGDLLAHKNSEPSFPQDTTANQWFTESQFESYRRLGQLSAAQALASLKDPRSRSVLASAFGAIKSVSAGAANPSGAGGSATK